MFACKFALSLVILYMLTENRRKMLARCVVACLRQTFSMIATTKC